MNRSPYCVPSHCTRSSHVIFVFLYFFSFHSSTRVYPDFFFGVSLCSANAASVVFRITISCVLLASCCNRFMYANSDSPGCCRHGESSGTALLRRAAEAKTVLAGGARQLLLDGRFQKDEKLVPKDAKIKPRVDARSKAIFIVVRSLVGYMSSVKDKRDTILWSSWSKPGGWNLMERGVLIGGVVGLITRATSSS